MFLISSFTLERAIEYPISNKELPIFIGFLGYWIFRVGGWALMSFTLDSPRKAGKGQNKPGLLLCASGLYTLHDVLQKNDWNEHEIENRAEWLLANAQNISNP